MACYVVIKFIVFGLVLIKIYYNSITEYKNLPILRYKLKKK